ncbi:MAG TPA: hypothetical protein VMU95_18215 [Trebonia sp.]|nr:hypothetical protein [Trebonia sp.]
MPASHESGRDGYSAGRDMNIHVHQGAAGPGPDERAIRARAERAAAFAELWRIAQEAHIGMRNNFDKADELSDVHRRINFLVIEKGPALDESDADLARGFLDALSQFIRLLRPRTDVPAERLREELVTSRAFHRMDVQLAILREAHQAVIGYDDLLTRRYRELVYGESPG